MLFHNRIWRPDELGLRDVVVEDQPFQDAAELGIAFLVPAQIGAEVIKRAHRAADVRQRQAREHFAVRHVFGRIGHRHRELARPHAGTAGGDPERRATSNGFNDGF